MTTAHREITSTLHTHGLIDVGQARAIHEKLQTMKTDDQRETYPKALIKQCAPIARHRGG